jgi:hypothetical protein
MKILFKCRRSELCPNLTKLSLWEKKVFSHALDFMSFSTLWELLHDACTWFVIHITPIWFTTERTCYEPAHSPFPGPFVSQAPETVTNFSSVIYAKARHLNLLKPWVYFVHHQFQHSKILHFAHIVNLCVSNESLNTQWLLPYMTFKGSIFITEMESVYWAVRTGSLIKQTPACPSRVNLRSCRLMSFVFCS